MFTRHRPWLWLCTCPLALTRNDWPGTKDPISDFDPSLALTLLPCALTGYEGVHCLLLLWIPSLAFTHPHISCRIDRFTDQIQIRVQEQDWLTNKRIRKTCWTERHCRSPQTATSPCPFDPAPYVHQTISHNTDRPLNRRKPDRIQSLICLRARKCPWLIQKPKKKNEINQKECNESRKDMLRREPLRAIR